MSDPASRPAASVAAVILAAGKGTRMNTVRPKALHEIAGLSMLGHVRAAVKDLCTRPVIAVIGPETAEEDPALEGMIATRQQQRRGTADALRTALPPICPALADFADGTLLVLFGDTPFVRPETLAAMVRAREAGADLVVLGFRPRDCRAYGRIISNPEGAPCAIVEHYAADAAQRRIPLCNSGVMAFAAHVVRDLVQAIGNDNPKREYYLTDALALATEKGLVRFLVEASEDELLGVNSLAELAGAEAIWQRARRMQALRDGVILRDPDSVWFAHDSVIAHDVQIGPHVVFGPGVTVEEGAVIHPFCHLEGTHIGPGATVGPFARIRPGAVIGAAARVGNFVEVKNADLAEGVKVNHLSYIGDASLGRVSNIGAGVITCNYDGHVKSRTVIGEGAFIGSNSSLVAPLDVGAGAVVGAGSTITRNVAPDALALARSPQQDRAGGAARLRVRSRGKGKNNGSGSGNGNGNGNDQTNGHSGD